MHIIFSYQVFWCRWVARGISPVLFIMYKVSSEIKQVFSVTFPIIICSGTLMKIYVNFSGVTELTRQACFEWARWIKLHMSLLMSGIAATFLLAVFCLEVVCLHLNNILMHVHTPIFYDTKIWWFTNFWCFYSLAFYFKLHVVMLCSYAYQFVFIFQNAGCIIHVFYSYAKLI